MDRKPPIVGSRVISPGNEHYNFIACWNDKSDRNPAKSTAAPDKLQSDRYKPRLQQALARFHDSGACQSAPAEQYPL